MLRPHCDECDVRTSGEDEIIVKLPDYPVVATITLEYVPDDARKKQIEPILCPEHLAMQLTLALTGRATVPPAVVSKIAV